MSVKGLLALKLLAQGSLLVFPLDFRSCLVKLELQLEASP
jgi:hypothetical protein